MANNQVLSRPTISVVILITTLSLITVFLTLSPPPPPNSPPQPHSLFLSSADNASISSLLRRLTLRPHLAGTPGSAAAAALVLSRLRSVGLQARSLPVPALLSFPRRPASLSAVLPNGSRIVFPISDGAGLVPPYHAYSAAAAASGPALFANHGRPRDYLSLPSPAAANGSVVIALRSPAVPRAAVVREAEARGAAAVLTFSSSSEFADGFERGTVLRGPPGDPQSPGWWSGGERLPADHPAVSGRFPKIPSLPLSLHVAESLLSTLGGDPLPRAWSGSLRSPSLRSVGPGPTILDLDYQGEKRVETISDVFAVIEGWSEPDRYVLLGNHRDAWTYGAVDPNSGTAAMLDVARRFSLLTRSGWRPRRTILLCSWDAEEFGMIGSTEWVEHNLLGLGAKAVAYLNVDCAVQGPGFFAGATPQLDSLLLQVLKMVNDPESEGATMYQKWTRNQNNTIERLGRVDSDFAAFVQHAGIPSVDMYYGRDFPAYHTAFDSYDWMKNHGDPLFHRHAAVAGVWGLLALRLADDPILPFDYRSYADQLKSYEETLSKLLGGLVSLSHLTTSIREFASAAKEAKIEARKLADQEATSEKTILRRRALNDRLMLAERGFLDSDGLEGRRWFKHLIYGPPGDPESEIDFFPGIADAISRSATMSTDQKKALIEHEIWRVVRAVQRATSALRGELNIGELT